MQILPHMRFLRVGLLVRGNKVWISEFVSIIFVSSTLLVLFLLTFAIIFNETRIRSHDNTIGSLKTDSLRITTSFNEFSQKVIIFDALKAFPGNDLSASMCAHLADLVYTNSKTFGYDPFLVLAVIQTESLFRSKARGKYRSGAESGAFGLMQLKLETAQEIGNNIGIKVQSIHDLFKPEINLAIGVAYLTQLIARFKSFKLGLLAYNQGPGVIKESLIAQTPLSINYYNKVLISYFHLKKSVSTTVLPGRAR